MMARKLILGVVPTCVGPPEGGRIDNAPLSYVRRRGAPPSHLEYPSLPRSLAPLSRSVSTDAVSVATTTPRLLLRLLTPEITNAVGSSSGGAVQNYDCRRPGHSGC